jgi:DNA-binding PadR family transcriptional regulator
MDFVACACTGKSLARFVRPAALAVLAQGPAHGYVISERLKAMMPAEEPGPDHSGVYRTLKLMEEEGLVSSAVEMPEAGPMRRRYRLTPKGRACLDRWVETLKAYRRSIDGVISLAHAAGRRPAERETS